MGSAQTQVRFLPTYRHDMEFLSGNVGTEIIEEIKKAEVVDIASEHFHPGDRVVGLLNEISELRIYVSEDFTTSDAPGLESLAADNRVRCISPDKHRGKLSGGLVLCRREDGTEVAFVGSVNFTGPSLFSNYEVCIKHDTRDGDGSAISEVKPMLAELDEDSYVPDWGRTRRRHETTKVAPDTAPGAREDTSYWILKTQGQALGSSTKGKVDYWDDFRAEDVIALGQAKLSFDPTHMRSRKAIRDRLRADGKSSSSAHLIDKFANGITTGDLVLLCRGYAPAKSGASSKRSGSSSGKVLFHGYARVKGDFYYDEDSSWWPMKYPAAIQEEEVLVPREIFVEAFDKKALPHPIHENGITENRVEDFCGRVESRFGIPLRL